MKGLSQKQRIIMDFIGSSIEDQGYPPSIREIAKGVGLKSTSTVAGHLTRLEKKGCIKRLPGIPRAIRIIKQ